MPGYRIRRNTAAGAAMSNPILLSGEMGFEQDTGRLKIGDGLTPWNALPYYVDSHEIVQLVNNAVAAAPASSSQALQIHIDSLAPHPEWDDGPSLVLLYENKKV